MKPPIFRRHFKCCNFGLSISDDDLCSECVHLNYNPGEYSHCRLNWPGWFDGDAYCQLCPNFLDHETRNQPAADTPSTPAS